MVNLFIVYELDMPSKDLNTDFVSVTCLFGAVKLTKKMLTQINMITLVMVLHYL